MNKKIFFFILVVLPFYYFESCTTEQAIPEYNGYPTEVGEIILPKCASKGCHTDESKQAAGGLSFESWDKLFEGGFGSACVIPYRSDYSTLFFYINTFSDLGITLKPTMPYNNRPLSKNEVVTIKKWIDNGAPNNEGIIKFSDNPNRKKVYIANQGCDVVTVLDQESLLPMSYINVGSSSGLESPHMIKVSPDGKYWYVIFLAGSYLEKYRTSDDSFVARSFIGSGYWNTMSISSNSETAYCIDLSATNAKIATVDLNTMTATSISGFSYPHGSSLNNTNDTLYVTKQVGSSKLYKIPVNDFSAYTEINLYTTLPSKPLNPHEIRFSPDGKKYAITCQGTSEVRIFETGTDKLLSIIPVGSMPSELSFSTTTNFLFVTCTEDTLEFSGRRGSVAIINYNTNTLHDVIYTGHQPHGIDVDDLKKIVYIANRNATNDGPAPHHSSACGGRNGYISFINLNTLKMITSTNGIDSKKIEVSVDPYSISIKK